MASPQGCNDLKCAKALTLGLVQHILHGSHCWNSFNTSNVGPTLNPSQSSLSSPEAARLEETPGKRAPWSVLGSLCSDGPSSFLPKAPKVIASLIPNKWWAQASGNGTYWSNTTTSQCPVYWRASLRARSLASDLQQKRWALLRQLRAFLPGACFLRETQRKVVPCQQQADSWDTIR